jgi:cell wall-associated NlpC family hydrolase
MNPLRFFAAALLAVVLTVLPGQTAQAQTKKSSSKKTTSTTKKKSTPKPTAKKSTPAPTETPGATSSLDLPLPAKVAPVKPANATSETKPAEAAASENRPTETAEKKERAPSATVEPETIVEFAAQPPKVQQLIRDALDLTRQNLTYTFGSADPQKGGMDCSGTMYYILRAHGLEGVPRDSAGQYLWARKSGTFFPVVSKNAESVEFKELQPGDLMFWTGTYQTGRDVPISHVMLYLGREKGSQKRIMFGASDGRSYNGIQRWGVSVFDFKMPRVDATDPEKAKVDFVGYARIPGLRDPSVAIAETTEAETKEPSPKPAETPKAAKTSKTKSSSGKVTSSARKKKQ